MNKSIDKNTEKYAAMPRSQVRRTDYQVTDTAQIKTWLHQGAYGVLATAHLDQPYATPVNYIYIEEDNDLYFHGARVGRMRANLALNPKVSFNISQMGALVPGECISDFGVAYQSVTVFGTAARVDNPEKTLSVLLALMRKYFPDHTPGEDYPLPEPDELQRTAVYRIKIEEWSAKQLLEDE
jgi:nitroimidazol reductase NimA-like FMN-containing flavoprotein (pyridoxamine 5'-phosphate oxidase superfamily)